ncbi:cytochrome ubiquinol oxidase subunit I [Enterovirga aerilata]|uniref:Cytochrome ubiquinol oxidase subunit I n=1 Tax=Enterovirga aerilata TaxID=2730920 RepID=A0A849HZT5_9HYPH|nr:cytochrome ubiquinol oxidase subunit I [Enterovirga sp. DB1703]NNM70814.1 cytochrome ubiquinol oxidase subunit I [Enterovirga sp. DB1703]
MTLDALMLSRIQFGFTIAFHIIFPAFTIGLASWLARLEFEWLRTGNYLYKNLYKFWVKIFAVSFGLGVVSGIVMSYQLGTNWSRYSEFGGNVLGPLIAYEVITAFCLEAGFLGIMLFGWDKVGDRLHFLSTCLVALGTLISAFWILSANSWMQTPAGFRIENGIALPVDWWQIIFNPSFPIRYAHMVLGCFLTTAFAVGGMSAWMLLRHPHDAPEAKLAGARTSLSMAMWFAVVMVPVQIFIGDAHGLGVLKHQPTKLAAIEANWERTANMPLLLFAIPDEKAEKNHYEIGIPKLGSFVLTHSFDGVVPGLKDVPPDQRPPVWPVFFSFRIMVGIGFLMLGLSLWSLYLRWRGTLFTNRPFLYAAMLMTPSGFGAVLFGWFVAEIGRQPWVIYGLLRTADAVSPVAAEAVATSLVTFMVVYAFIFGFGSYYLAKLLRRGPDPVETMPGEELGKMPKRPFSVPSESLEGGPGRRALPAE